MLRVRVIIKAPTVGRMRASGWDVRGFIGIEKGFISTGLCMGFIEIMIVEKLTWAFLSNQGEKSIHSYFIMVPLSKKVYSRTQKVGTWI